MHDVTARPLYEAQRVLETVFKGLLDTAYATTRLGFVFTTDEQLYAEQLLVEEFNAEAEKAGWHVRLEQFGPALPDILYKFDGSDVPLERRHFRPAPPGAGYVEERCRRLGRASPPERTLRLHHEYAKVNGKLVPARQGPVISKPNDGIGWALEYRPVGGLCFFVGDVSTIKLKRGEWLSDTFAALWLLGDVLGDAPLWAIGSPQAHFAERPAYQKMFQRLARQRWDRVLRKRVFWQRFDQVFARSSEDAAEPEIERCPLAYYWAFRSAVQRAYIKPYREHFWIVKEYWEYGPLGIRQHGSPVRHIAVTPALAAFYLWLWRQLPTPAEQRRLKLWGRLYKWDCWSNYRFDDRSSAYLQVNETWEQKDTRYRRFDQRAHAYLYPEHAPSPERFGSQIICLPPRDHARLEATRESYNAEQGSYWNSSSINCRGRVDRFDDQNWRGPFKVPSERFREQRSLSIPRETIEVRNNMIANLENDFGRDEATVA